MKFWLTPTVFEVYYQSIMEKFLQSSIFHFKVLPALLDREPILNKLKVIINSIVVLLICVKCNGLIFASCNFVTPCGPKAFVQRTSKVQSLGCII